MALTRASWAKSAISFQGLLLGKTETPYLGSPATQLLDDGTNFQLNLFLDQGVYSGSLQLQHPTALCHRHSGESSDGSLRELIIVKFFRKSSYLHNYIMDEIQLIALSSVMNNKTEQECQVLKSRFSLVLKTYFHVKILHFLFKIRKQKQEIVIVRSYISLADAFSKL